MPLALATARLDLGLGVIGLAVLASELDRGAVLALAEVRRVDDQAPFAAEHFQHELGDRRVGNRFKGVANAALDRVDPTNQLNFDRLIGGPVQSNDEVAQLNRHGER